MKCPINTVESRLSSVLNPPKIFGVLRIFRTYSVLTPSVAPGSDTVNPETKKGNEACMCHGYVSSQASVSRGTRAASPLGVKVFENPI